MVLDVKCAFLYGECKRKIYIELPRQDQRHGDGGTVGVLRKTMYGTRDAPQIWQKDVQKVLENEGFEVSLLQPSVYHHKKKDMLVVVHVDDFLCSGDLETLGWLYETLKKKYDLKKDILKKSGYGEVKYLNRSIRHMDGHFEKEGDPKHVELLVKEWGMEHCKPVDTPITKNGQDCLNDGDELKDDDAKKVRRAIARINYMSQDRADLSVAARVLSQGMARPREGAVQGVKRVIRYLKGTSRCVLLINPSVAEEEMSLIVFTDSDWAGDGTTRRTCSGGCLVLNGTTVSHWSKVQSNVALSSGEAELNAAVKGISESIGLTEIVQECLGVKLNVEIKVDANACKGILLRHGAGRVKHLCTKQLWVQGAIESYGLVVRKVPREQNPADVLTHPSMREGFASFLEHMSFSLQNSPGHYVTRG